MRRHKTLIRGALALALFGGVLAQAPAYAEGPSCAAFRWVTLGTAGGPTPDVDRSEPAHLLIAGKRHVLVDSGDGTVDALAQIGTRLSAIDTVVISHHHLDHTGGLAAVIGLRWMSGAPEVLTVYGPPGTKEIVDGVLTTLGPQARIGFSVGELPPPPAGSVRVIEVKPGDQIQLDDLVVKTVENTHFYAEGEDVPHVAASLSLRFEFGGRAITFTGDTGPSTAVTRFAAGSDLLVSEVVDLDRILKGMSARQPNAKPEQRAMIEKHLSTHHLTPAEVGRLAASARVGRVVLTHYAFPGPLAASEDTLRNGIRAHFAGPVDLAQDLQSFDIGCR